MISVKNFRIILISGFIAIIIFFTLPAYATSDCDMADDTASLQNCLRKELTSSQDRLNKVYKKLIGGLEVEKKTELEELQQSWLTYRDKECMWEKEQAEQDSLKVMNELSCMATVTDNRATLLENAYMTYDHEGPREFSNVPRWVNALQKDHSAIHWDIDTVFEADLTCDDSDEIIVTGIAFDEAETKSDRLLYEKKMTIAVINNPEVGRPDITPFTFLVDDQKNEETVCNKGIKFSVIEENQGSGEDNTETQPVCLKFLEASQMGCATHIVDQKNGKFSLREKQKQES